MRAGSRFALLADGGVAAHLAEAGIQQAIRGILSQAQIVALDQDTPLKRIHVKRPIPNRRPVFSRSDTDLELDDGSPCKH